MAPLPVVPPGELIKTGAGGQLTVTGSIRVSFTGKTTINQGSARVEGGNATGGTSGAVQVSVNSGGVLEIGGISFDRKVVLNDGGTLLTARNWFRQLWDRRLDRFHHGRGERQCDHRHWHVDQR